MAAMPAITWKQPTVMRITAAKSAQPIAQPLGSFWLKGFLHAQGAPETGPPRLGRYGEAEARSITQGGRSIAIIPMG